MQGYHYVCQNCQLLELVMGQKLIFGGTYFGNLLYCACIIYQTVANILKIAKILIYGTLAFIVMSAHFPAPSRTCVRCLCVCVVCVVRGWDWQLYWTVKPYNSSGVPWTPEHRVQGEPEVDKGPLDTGITSTDLSRRYIFNYNQQLNVNVYLKCLDCNFFVLLNGPLTYIRKK